MNMPSAFFPAREDQAQAGRQLDAGPDGYRTRQIESMEGFRALEEAWRELYETSDCSSVFSSWEWISGWYAHFVPTLSRRGTGAVPVVLAVYDAWERLVGVLPFVQVPTRCAWIGERRLIQVGLMTYDGLEPEEPTLLCRPESQAVVWRAIQRHLTARRLPGGRWNHFTMYALHPGAVVSANGISRAHSSRWLQSHFVTGSLTVPLPPTWDAFRSRLSKSMRDNLAYYPRRLTRHGLPWRVRILESRADVLEALPILVALHKRRAQSTRGVPHLDHLPTARHRDFLRRCLPDLAAQGLVFLAVLEVDGVAIAAQVFLQSAGVVTFYYSGFEPDWHDFSPVTILGEAVIRRAIGQKMSKINFLPEDKLWKSRWQARYDTPKEFLVGFSPHPISFAYAALRRCYRKNHI
jgi:CelD/BcsL family acetyltransferase involved in cellulose biosynthesis